MIDFKLVVSVRRPSKWGNPFVVGIDGTKAECVAKHKAWILTQPDLLNDLHELKGKHLICCQSKPCHKDTLAMLANTGAEVLA